MKLDQRMKDFMGKNSSFSAEEMEAIMKDLVIESYEKNTILLKQGEISSKCFLS